MLAKAAPVVYGAENDALVDAFIVQTLSSMEGLDDGNPTFDWGSIFNSNA